MNFLLCALYFVLGTWYFVTSYLVFVLRTLKNLNLRLWLVPSQHKVQRTKHKAQSTKDYRTTLSSGSVNPYFRIIARPSDPMTN